MSTSVSNLPPPNIHNDPGIADTSGPQQISPTGIASEKYTEGPHTTLTETSSIQSRNVSTQRPPHPHLGNQFSNEINEINHPKTQVVDAGIIDRLRNEGIIDKKGNINFSKFGTPLSRHKAKLSGSIYLEGDKLQINIEGTCGPEAAKILQQLKTAVNGDSNSPLTINPQIINISQTDENLLARGGQIQYKPLSNGKILKLTLDPGENGQGDGLTLSVWNNGYKIQQGKAKKIPLSVVFEGQPLDGVRVLRDGRPILEDWGKRQLFENSVIKTEEEKIFFFTKTQSDNTTDIGRTEAKNTLWRAVYEYLRNTQESEQSDALQQQPSTPPPPNEAQKTPKEAPVQPENVTETPKEALKPETPTAVAAASIPVEKRITQPKPLRSLTSTKAKRTDIKTPKPKSSLLEAAKRLSEEISRLRDTLATSPDLKEAPATVEGFATKPPQEAMAEVVEIPQVQMAEAPKPTSVEPNTLGLEPQQAIEEEMAATPQTDKEAHPVITSAIHGGIAKTENKNLLDAANGVLKALQGLLESLNENNEPAQEALKQAQDAVLALDSQIPETEKLQQATLLANNLTALVQTLKRNSTAESNLQLLLDAAQSLSKAISELATQPSVSATGQAATSIPKNTPKPQRNLKATNVVRAKKREPKLKNNNVNALGAAVQGVVSGFESVIDAIKTDPTAATDTGPTSVATETHGKIPVSEAERATGVQARTDRKSISKKRDTSKQRKTELVKAAKDVDKAFQALGQAAQESQTDETKPQLKAVEEEAFRVT